MCGFFTRRRVRRDVDGRIPPRLFATYVEWFREWIDLRCVDGVDVVREDIVLFDEAGLFDLEGLIFGTMWPARSVDRRCHHRH